MLRIRKLTVHYGPLRALIEISLEVKEGEVLVILGPNGAGKTTLLRALLGLISYRGKITWRTEDISYLPPQEMLKRKDLPPLSIEDFFIFQYH